jgi:hypothetical protein
MRGVYMRMTSLVQSSPLNLRNGEIVEVRTQEEILATLDSAGELESLPFMPEMLQFCGKRFRVFRRAVKLCDTINWTGKHRLENTVHLEGLRCDGGAHGGCQAGCLLYWKEAWLKRVEPDDQDWGHKASDAPPSTSLTSSYHPHPVSMTDPLITVDSLFRATRADAGTAAAGEERYSCQATEMMRAAPVRMAWWDPRQYIRDVAAGNVGTGAMVRYLFIMMFNKFQAANRRFFPKVLLIRNARDYPFVDGKLTKTPKGEILNLQPGELVEIRSKEEIVRTLDTNNRNRGLLFDIEMVNFCGKRARVLRRVVHIINEKTGEMMHFSNDCIILDGIACLGEYRGYCPRSIYSYWREAWLKRVEEPVVITKRAQSSHS